MAISTMFTKFIGSKYFHSNVNSWSIRNRGKVHLNHIIKKTSMMAFNINQNTPSHGHASVIPKGDNHAPKNTVVAMAAIMNILMNSAKKK